MRTKKEGNKNEEPAKGRNGRSKGRKTEGGTQNRGGKIASKI